MDLKFRIWSQREQGQCYAWINGQAGKVSNLDNRTNYQSTFHIQAGTDLNQNQTLQLWKYKPLKKICSWSINPQTLYNERYRIFSKGKVFTVEGMINLNGRRSRISHITYKDRTQSSQRLSAPHQNYMKTILRDKINQLHSRKILAKNQCKSKKNAHSLIFPGSYCSFESTIRNMTADEVKNIGNSNNQEQIQNVYGLGDLKSKLLKRRN